MQLIDAAHSLLLVIDIQEKLLPAIHAHAEMLEHCAWLIKLANKIEIPIFISEQYPQGLGYTAVLLRELAPCSLIQTKHEFSCMANPQMRITLEKFAREHIIICGMETHVCVLQTAIELANMGKQIFIVSDATSTRHLKDKHGALARMSQHPNIQIVTREMVLFEWMQCSGTPLFKEISQQFLQENKK